MTMKILVLLIFINIKSISSYSLCGSQVKGTRLTGDNYKVTIDLDLMNGTYVAIEFNSDVTINVGTSAFFNTVQKVWGAYHLLRVNFEGVYDNVFEVKSNNAGIQPYIKNMFINQEEYCKDYEFMCMGGSDHLPSGGLHTRLLFQSDKTKSISIQIKLSKVYMGSTKSKPVITPSETVILTSSPTEIVEDCGKRKLEFTELVIQGDATRPGDWPWHVAIYKQAGNKKTYGGGGTLISKRFVITAAHCVTSLNAPDPASILTVVLGKYNLNTDDTTSQEREVESVIVHENFRVPKQTDNDIALLKLKTEANYNKYVQPACVWYDGAYDKLPTNIVMGSVVGWGMDETYKLSEELKHAIMPEVSYADCIMKKPEFYGIMLSNRLKFCAGWGNGTSACNGDSGGGYFVFVPDTAKNSSPFASGAWHVKGIISVAVALQNYRVCDPQYYVVFTDIPKYKDWIRRNTNINFT